MVEHAAHGTSAEGNRPSEDPNAVLAELNKKKAELTQRIKTETAHSADLDLKIADIQQVTKDLGQILSAYRLVAAGKKSLDTQIAPLLHKPPQGADNAELKELLAKYKTDVEHHQEAIDQCSKNADHAATELRKANSELDAKQVHYDAAKAKIKATTDAFNKLQAQWAKISPVDSTKQPLTVYAMTAQEETDLSELRIDPYDAVQSRLNEAWYELIQAKENVKAKTQDSQAAQAKLSKAQSDLQDVQQRLSAKVLQKAAELDQKKAN